MYKSILVCALMLANCAVAASFDCSKAVSFAEQTVCSDTDLSLADEALARVYRAALVRTLDKDALLKRQRQWLAARNSCQDNGCVQNSYGTRLKELSLMAFAKKGMGIYRCRSRGVEFVVENGVVTDFNAVTAVSSPDLAQGYSSSCTQHIGLFYQAEGGQKYVLRFNSDENQYGESLKCQVHIEDLDSKFRVLTSNCKSECMKFKFEVSKTGKACYHSP